MATKPRRRAGRKRRQDVKRQPSGQIRKSVYAERVTPTKEMQARRADLLGDKNATGEIDCALDVIASPAHRLITPKQAEAYGIHELHVLEDVLRQSTQEVKAQVALRIRQKIGWHMQPGETDTAFLDLSVPPPSSLRPLGVSGPMPSR